MNIKIFMCCHKAFALIPPLCEPIQGGRAINGHIPDIGGDDRGENISDKNKEYCELTVIYYAWKNESHDFYGFCHYRRFFCFDISPDKPYHVCGKLTDRLQKKFLGTPELIRDMCRDNDIIVPRDEDMGMTVREHYCTSAHHFSEDLDLFLGIMGKMFPELIPFADSYMSQNRQYFCNMFIMDKFHFDEYCRYLFGILEEFDRCKKLHGNFNDDRTDGYLGERFLGIYLTYLAANGAKIKKISRLDAFCSLKKRAAYILCPPESRRRFLAKKIKRILW